MTIADVIEKRREDILTRWERAMVQLLAPRVFSRDDLLDSCPEFLSELADAMRKYEQQGSRDLFDFSSTVAERHAQQRLRLGIDVSLLIREYGLLRDCVLRVLEQARKDLHISEVLVIGRAIDSGAMRAVGHYLHLKDQREREALGSAQQGQASAESALASVRRAESALRESEERFRLLIDSVQDYGVFMVSVDGRVSGWNPGAQRLKRYTAEEVIGAPLSLFFPPGEVAERVPERLIERAAAEDQSQYEGWILRRDGSRFWATVSLYAVKDEAGRLRGFSNVARDNTARKRAEEQQAFLSSGAETLARSLNFDTTLQELARLATRGLADWCAIFPLSGAASPIVRSHADPAKLPLLEAAIKAVPTDTTLGRGVAHVARTGESELCVDTHEEAWVRVALGVETAPALQSLVARSYICVPLTMRGKTYAVMALVSTTPHRRYSVSDLAFAEELARRGAIAVENARLYQEAQSAIRARDEFISMASHDLRTPLAALRLLLQKVLHDAKHAKGQVMTADAVAKPLSQMDKQVGRLVQMMDSLLDVTTISAGKMRLERSETDLVELARESVRRFSDELARAGCEVSVEGEDPVLGLWDPFRLEQVMANLLSNAAKYGKGKPIEIRVTANGPYARLAVRDHGIGIAPEDQANLFERFERVHPHKDVGGFGVGLWIVSRIIDAHGGRIRVKSEPGEGSTFIIELARQPVTQEDAHEPSLEVH